VCGKYSRYDAFVRSCAVTAIFQTANPGQNHFGPFSLLCFALKSIARLAPAWGGGKEKKKNPMPSAMVVDLLSS
jgi:hypothetical protein